LLAFLVVLGPGIITSAADNDAGGITTYSVAGAKYGYQLLWVIVVITAVLMIVQEMSARMGVVTQKGLGELIREQFGVRWTLFALSVLLFANVATTVAEFAGISASANIFGISRYISVPLCAVAVWFLVVKGSFKIVERVFLALALLYGTYVISGIMAHPNWGEVWQTIIHPSLVPDVKPLTARLTADYLFLIIGVVGTTITPWMQFFLQATVVDKGADVKHYFYQKLDVLVGSVLTDIVSFFIIVAAAASIYFGHAVHKEIKDASELADALRPLAGNSAAWLFGIGLFAASLLAAAVLPLSTAYTFTEAFGFEVGIRRSLREAPAFYGIFTGAIVVGAGVALLPHFDPLKAMIWSQVVNGMLLPIILYFMLKLINDKSIMGEYTNSSWYNAIVWLTAFFLVVFSLVILVSSFIPTPH
jgi:NRAMP (natural resistance-associated macrophage protein)-like metal ion transporter